MTPTAPWTNTVVTWTANGRTLTGVPPQNNPAPPSERWAPLAGDRAPTHLDGFGPQTPSGDCANLRAVPTAEQLARVQGALAAAPEADGVFEVVLLADGCARLVEWRTAGDVRRWELRRFWQGAWKPAVQWDFDPGVKRPSTVDRYGMQEGLHRFGEWAKDEVHRKTFWALDRPPASATYTHYRGESALFVEGNPSQKISANHATKSCRLDGSNHCDALEAQRFRFFDNPH